MQPPEFFLAVIAILSFTGLSAFVIGRITGLIKLRLEKKSQPLSEDELAALRQFKTMQNWQIRAEKRLQNLEEIASDNSDDGVPLLDKLPELDDLTNRPVPNQLRTRS